MNPKPARLAARRPSFGGAVLVALGLASCDSATTPPTLRPVVHLVDEPLAHAESEFLETQLPPIVEPAFEARYLGNGRVASELPWPAFASATVELLDDAGDLPRAGSLKELAEQTRGFVHFPRVRRWDASDHKGILRILRPSVHEPTMWRFRDGDPLELPMEMFGEASTLRVRSRVEDNAGAVLTVWWNGELVEEVEIGPEWTIWEWPVAGGLVGEFRCVVSFAEGKATDQQFLAQVQWVELERSGKDQVVALGLNSESVTLRYVPQFPTAKEVLSVSPQTREVTYLDLGGTSELIGESLPEQIQVGDQTLDRSTPFALPSLGAGLRTFRVPDSAFQSVTVQQHCARFLPFLQDLDTRLEDDLSPTPVPPGEPTLAARVSSDHDRRVGFLLPTASKVEWEHELVAGDRLRFSWGIADPVGDVHGNSAQDLRDGTFAARVTWTKNGRELTIDECTVNGHGWVDREREVDANLAGRGVLRFETLSGDSSRGPTLAALGDPRLVPPREQQPKRWNLLFYLVDTLRADALSCYGAEVPSSPFLDEYAARGYLFEKLYAVASWTRPTTASIMTGLYPTYHGITSDDRALPFRMVTLAEALRAEGYSNWAALSNLQVSAPGVHFEQGFHRFVAPQKMGIDNPHAQVAPASTLIADEMLPWLEHHLDEPFFLYLHSMDPHLPYLPPPPDQGMFSSNYDGVLEGIPLLGVLPFWQRIQQLGLEDFEFARRVYQEEIRFQDRELKRLVTFLEDQGLDDNTLVIVVSDHGEEFYEHQGLSHAGRMWQEMLHVPLVIVAPPALAATWAPAPQRIATPISQVDLFPGMLELLGVPLPGSHHGESFVPLLRGEEVPDRPIYAVERDDLGAVLHGPWKYIWRTDRNTPREHVYRLTDDPVEQTDLSEEDPTVLKSLRQMRARLEKEFDRRTGPAGAPAAVQFDEDVIEALKALGYLDDSESANQGE